MHLIIWSVLRWENSRMEKSQCQIHSRHSKWKVPNNHKPLRTWLSSSYSVQQVYLHTLHRILNGIPCWLPCGPLTNLPIVPKLEEVHLIAEAEYVQKRTLDILRAEEDLTVSYYGGTIKGHEAFWTIHVSTSDHRVYFLAGREATQESHWSMDKEYSIHG